MRWRHAALLLIAAFAIGNWQLLIGRGVEKWDASDLGTPYYSLLADYARSLRFLYWNPWIAGGSPDFAIAGSATFSPDFLLFAALTGPGGNGFVAYWLLTWLAGGLGMLALARHLGATPCGGLVIALGFTFSGFYTGHAEHPGLLYAYSLLPFIVWRLDVAVKTRKVLVAAQAGALWGLCGLAGYPAFTIYTIALIGGWVIGRKLCESDAETCTWPRLFALLVVTGAVGTAILSPSYVSAAYETAGYSDRSGPLPRETLLRINALHPAALVTLGSPAYPELKVASNELWSYTDVSCLSLYTGAAALVLAAIGLAGSPRRRWRWFIALIAGLALCCAMSRVFPFRGWIYDLLPPTRYFRHSGMLRGYFLFAVSILAIYGWKTLVAAGYDRLVRRRLLIPVSGAAIFAFSTYIAFASLGDITRTNWILAMAHLLIVWGGLVFIALRLPRRLLPAAIGVVALTDAFFTSQLGESTVFERGPRPALPEPASSSITLGPESFPRSIGMWKRNINLQMKVPTFRNYAPFKNEFHEIIAAVPVFAEMALGRNRIWFSTQAPEVAPTGEAFSRFANRMWQLNQPIVVRHSREMMLDDKLPGANINQIDSLPAAVRIPSVVERYEPEKLVLNVTAPAEGWVMVSDRWARSWRATVNGVEQPVAGGNFVFRALHVAPGENHIEFSFTPLAVPALVVLSWGTLAAVGCATALQLRRRQRAAQSDEVFDPTPAAAAAV